MTASLCLRPDESAKLVSRTDSILAVMSQRPDVRPAT